MSVSCDLIGYNRSWNNIDSHYKGRVSNFLRNDEDYLMNQITEYIDSRNGKKVTPRERSKRVVADFGNPYAIISRQSQNPNQSKIRKNQDIAEKIKSKEKLNRNQPIVRSKFESKNRLTKMQKLRISKYINRMKRRAYL